MSNPFRYQGPVSPEELVDRVEELDALQRAAADRVSVRLAAPRRFGKSSLLGAHLQTMARVGHRTVLVDLSRVATVSDVAARVLTAYRELPPDPGRLLEGLSRRMGLSVGPAGVTVQLGPRSAPAQLGVEQARQLLLEVLDIPARLHAADGTLTVVAFDEFQDLLTADDKLDGVFRSVIQHHGKAVAYVYAGSRPSLLREMFAEQERPFFGQARPLDLPLLPFGETVAELGETFRRHELLPGAALTDVVTVGAGHPQRTMLLAHHLFNALDEGGTGDLAAVALDRSIAETADVHQATWDGLGRAERAIVVALADGLAPTGQRTAREHAITRSALQHALRKLIAEQQHVVAGPALLDPLFAEWLRRR